MCKISALSVEQTQTRNKYRSRGLKIIVPLRHSIGVCLPFINAEDPLSFSLPDLRLLRTKI